jgi:hypothetical protein
VLSKATKGQRQLVETVEFSLQRRLQEGSSSVHFKPILSNRGCQSSILGPIKRPAPAVPITGAPAVPAKRRVQQSVSNSFQRVGFVRVAIAKSSKGVCQLVRIPNDDLHMGVTNKITARPVVTSLQEVVSSALQQGYRKGVPGMKEAHSLAASQKTLCRGFPELSKEVNYSRPLRPCTPGPKARAPAHRHRRNGERPSKAVYKLVLLPQQDSPTSLFMTISSVTSLFTSIFLSADSLVLLPYNPKGTSVPRHLTS